MSPMELKELGWDVQPEEAADAAPDTGSAAPSGEPNATSAPAMSVQANPTSAPAPSVHANPTTAPAPSVQANPTSAPAPPSVQATPTAAPASVPNPATASATSVQPPRPAEAKADVQVELQGGMTRRAAANLLSRVKDSESRMKSEFPEWMHSFVSNPVNKPEMITLIQEMAGDLKAVNARLNVRLQEEKIKSNMAKTSMTPFTEMEIIAKYGADEAKNVVKQKIDQNLTVPDPNKKGGLLYLMQQDVTEFKRGSKETRSLTGEMDASQVCPKDLRSFMSFDCIYLKT